MPSLEEDEAEEVPSVTDHVVFSSFTPHTLISCPVFARHWLEKCTEHSRAL